MKHMTAVVRKRKVGLEEALEFQKKLNEESIVVTLGDKLPPNTDRVIALGGDGTALAVAKEYPNHPIMSVNYGHLGFLSALNKDDDPNGEFKTIERITLKNSFCDYLALNEIVIARGSIPRSVKMAVYIDDILLSKYSADGIIISTPTGSTAYNLSAHGPIISNDVDCIIITPICPHFNKNNSVVVGMNSVVRIKLLSNTKTFITIDGQITKSLNPGQEISISLSDKRIKFLYDKNYNFISRISEGYKK